MPVYFVIYSHLRQAPTIQVTVKVIHKVIKGNLEDFQKIYEENRDLLCPSYGDFKQIEVIMRPDTSHLEEDEWIK